jgi:uncharacterized membrane protein YfcA
MGVEFLLDTHGPELKENLFSNFEKISKNQMEIDQLFVPVEKLRNKALLMVAVIMVVMIIVLTVFIKSITEPLQQLMNEVWLAFPAGFLISMMVSSIGIGGGILWMPFSLLVLKINPDIVVPTSLLVQTFARVPEASSI